MTDFATDHRTQTADSGWPSKAFKRTFLPILILSALSLLGAVTQGYLYIAWFGAAAYGAIALIVSVFLFLIWLGKSNPQRHLKVGSGRMLAGVLLGIPVLFFSCSINIAVVMSTAEWTF